MHRPIKTPPKPKPVRSRNDKSPFPTYLNFQEFSLNTSPSANADTPIQFSPLPSNRLIPLEPLLPKRVRAETNKEHPAELDQQTLPELGSMYLAHENRYRKIKLIWEGQEL